MIHLRVNNSTSQLISLSIKEYAEVKELMSYTLDPKAQYYSKSFGSGKKTLINKKGEFPTGLLYIAEKWLLGKPHITDDQREVPISKGIIKLTLPHEPYIEQVEAANAAWANIRGIISAVTGFGKSTVIALIIQKLKVPTLVVVPSLELKRQLSKSLSEAFGANMVGPGKFISVENVDALKMTPEKYYNSVIIDEFHHSAAKTYRDLNKKAWGNVFYRIGLTATPFRSNDNERLLLESVLSEVIYDVPHKLAVDKGYIVRMDAFYITIPKTKKAKEYANYAAGYSDLIVNNPERNALIQEVLIKFKRSNTSTLCLVKEIAHGEILSADGAFHFVSGQNDERHLIADFCDERIKVLIGTSGVLGEGVDTRPCEAVIVATPVKSRNLFMQMVGRSFRRYPGKQSAIIILIKDEGHKWFKSAFKEQVKILAEEYGVVPEEIKLEVL